MIKIEKPQQIDEGTNKTIIQNITEEQIFYAKELANEIRKARRKKYKDKGKNTQKNSKKIDYVGFLGETIFADTFNLDRPILEEDIDKGIDFHMGKFSYQIKTTDKIDFGMTLFLDSPLKAQFFVLININLTDKVALINKPITRNQIRENSQIIDFGYGDRIFIEKKWIMENGFNFPDDK